ncbi:hypothetical protein RB614_43245 [Phytohabitans sp. ZYX-F-186]|uniref:Uncharacterized protein n=1 Tax=Phytohabitans maris TaxID=3071409 RepID=A0ABU0ZXT3_9ACTN|nr:hypothetical protein [Phytohabitans sp. ZYX-F-186]MDQ7911327.1 hypothetical protein [Phytohabitans sp. ZYX-F-186]
MAEHVDQTPETETDVERPGSVLDLQQPDGDESDVEAHSCSPLCMEV